jgi:hypothetical protein
MISAALMGFILTGILTTFLFMGRSGANVANYTDMETGARKALEVFAEDVRQASVVTWSTASGDQYTLGGSSYPAKLTLRVGSQDVVYWYDRSSSPMCFKRTDASGNTTVLLRQVDQFQYTAYQIINPSMDPLGLNRTSIPISLSTLSTVPADAITANKLTKQIQISLRMSRTSTTVAAATNSVLSARYILRNKLIVN